MLTRRDILKLLALFGVGTVAGSSYVAAETFGNKVTRYDLTPPGWPPSLQVRLAVIADIHACYPWMSVRRINGIVAETNAMQPDAVLLLGDYVPSSRIRKYSQDVSAGTWATALAKLKAPLGVHAVLGNHDWWDDREVQRRRAGPTPAGLALEAVGIPVYENDAIRVEKDGQGFWIAGLGDQWAFWPRPEDYETFKANGKKDYTGVHDMAAMLAKVTDDAPIILMAHEPDIFPTVPERVSLTLSGHTHGGQVNLFGYTPIVPSRFGSRYVYGHIVEDKRHLIVSAGLGVSGLPVRFGATPEIVMVHLGTGAAA